MTTRSLIQSAWQVRALLEGRRTQVRVPLKSDTMEGTWPTEEWGPWEECEPGLWIGCNNEGTTIFARCPLGAPGTVLAVRETFAIESNLSIESAESYTPPFNDGRPVLWHEDEEFGRWWQQCHYKATDPPPTLCCERERCRACGSESEPCDGYGPHWRSPAIMPAWASRLTLRVLDVRCHLVREISESDAKAEGVAFYVPGHGPVSEAELRTEHGLWSSGSYRLGLEVEWEAQHGAGSWERDWCFAAGVEIVNREETP